MFHKKTIDAGLVAVESLYKLMHAVSQGYVPAAEVLMQPPRTSWVSRHIVTGSPRQG